MYSFLDKLKTFLAGYFMNAAFSSSLFDEELLELFSFHHYSNWRNYFLDFDFKNYFP
jgi:hypothetical protein